MILTGLLDTAIQVALHLHPYHLNLFFRLSHVHAALAQNQIFWSLKTPKDYGTGLTYNEKEETWRERYIHLTTIGSPYKAVRLGLVYCLEDLAARRRLPGPRAITIALLEGQLDALNWLLERGYKSEISWETFEFSRRYGTDLIKSIYKSALPILYVRYAIRSGDVQLLGWLVDQGCVINRHDLWRVPNNTEIIGWLKARSLY